MRHPCERPRQVENPGASAAPIWADPARAAMPPLCARRRQGYPLLMSLSRPEIALEAARFIERRLPVAPVAGVPEVRLHRATPSSGLSRLANDLPSPYWAYAWAGGLALARHILDRPAIVAGRRTLDLGAGSGLVGIAAAKAGASAVIASDVDPYARAALRLNAAANGVAFAAIVGELTDGPPPEVDVVAVGDLFYEDLLASRVAGFLERCVAAGLQVVIGDPWRRFLPRSQLTLLAEYRVADFGDGSARGAAASAVFAFAPRPLEKPASLA